MLFVIASLTLLLQLRFAHLKSQSSSPSLPLVHYQSVKVSNRTYPQEQSTAIPDQGIQAHHRARHP